MTSLLYRQARFYRIEYRNAIIDSKIVTAARGGLQKPLAKIAGMYGTPVYFWKNGKAAADLTP
jgi:hypothetical protein